MLKRGFTLIELLVAMAALAFVLLYTLGTFTANRNTYVVIESVSEAHQNTLAIASLIERDLRHAGYMVRGATAACGVDSTTGPDTLFVSDSDAILTADDLESTSVEGHLGAEATGGMGTSWTSPRTITLSTLVLDRDASDNPSPSYDTDGNGTPDSDFRPNAGVIFANPDFPSYGVYCGTVTAVDVANSQITVALASPPPSATFGRWVFVPAHVFSIQAGALRRDGVVMAPDVEDLQAAWFYDFDENDQISNAAENPGASGSPVLDASSLADASLLREVRFNLVVRTSDDDPNHPTAGIGQPRENQTVAPAADRRRRRVHTSTIRLRNLAT